MSELKQNPWENSSNSSQDIGMKRTQTNKSLNDIDLRRLLYIWPYVLLCSFLGFALGKLYTRYTISTFSVSTKINIQQKEEITLQQAVAGVSRDPFNDRIAFLKSPALAISVVDSLRLMYNTSLIGRFKDKSLYGIVDWKILNQDQEKLSKESFNFTIVRRNKKFFITKNGEEINEFEFNKPQIIAGDTLIVNILKDFNFNSPINLNYIDRWNLASGICNNFLIKADKESNIIDITYSDISTKRAKDVLNILVQSYNDILGRDKSRGFSQAINFINGRIQPLAKELDSIENELSAYQSSRGFVSENSNGALYLDKVKEIDQKLADIDIQESNIDSINQYLNNNNKKEVNYAIIGISDLNVQNNISLLTQLNAEKERLLTILTSNHPKIKILENNIEETKKSIKLQLLSYKKSIDISRQFYLGKINQANELIRTTPEDEKGLIDIKRVRNMKEALFLALLQKREEAAIAKASTTIDTKTLSPASVVPAQQKPSKSIILILATFLGMVFPILFFICVELLNNKIISKNQIESYLNIPVIAELEFVENRQNQLSIILGKTDRSMFGERLRALRTQLNFYHKNNNKAHNIIITSNISGEGKSFISLNLAKSFSLQNKKVALLEFDLRRPKISSLLNIEKSIGLTNFLLEDLKLESIFYQPFSDDNNFYFFPAGPIPPNPQELLSDTKLNELSEYLKNNYDVVIIDTPPFGIVADAQILSKIADTTLIVTRFGYTLKDQIVEIKNWNQNKIFPSMAIIFNGIKTSGYFGNKYGYYYYRRKYGYDYYSSKS